MQPETNVQSPTGNIPKIIHQIWIGTALARPKHWMNTWRDMNPGSAQSIRCIR